MSSILASVSVLLGAEISEFKAKMAEARRELSGLVKFSEGLKDIGTSLTQYVSLPLAALGAASVAASGKVESLRNALNAINTQDLAKQNVTGLAAVAEAADLTTERMAELQRVAKQPGLGFEAAVQGDVRLRAVGISSEQSAKSLKAFANAIALTGGGKSELSGVTVQLAQLSAKGKVLAQDLRPIIEAAPAVSGALQTLYGTVDSETISASLKKQGRNSTDFIKVLTDQLAKLPQVMGGLKNGLENFFDSATLAASKFGDGISKALNLPAVLAGVSDFITGLADRFAGLSPGMQQAIVALGAVAVAIGPVLVAVGTLGAALPAITAGFAVLGVESLAALGPLLPIAAAVGAAAYVIIRNWDALTAYFAPTGEGGRVFRELADSISNSVSQIGQALDSLSGKGSNLGDMVSAASVIKDIFKDVAVGLTAFSDVVGGTIGAITQLLRGEFSAALDQAKRAAFGLIDPLANLFGFSKAGPQQSFAEFFKLADALKAADKAALDDAASNNENTASLERNARAAGLLAVLEERLKDAREAKPNLTSEADIAASNLLIASLEAQIKRLNELGIGSKKAQDALAKLAAELRGNGELSNALGASYNFLGERQKILESGLKSLVQAGVSPASAAFQKYASELLRLNQILGDNAALQARTVVKPKDAPEFKVQTQDEKGGELDTANGRSPYRLPKRLQTLPIDTSATVQSLTNFQSFVLGFQASIQEIGESMTSSLSGAFSGIAQGVGEALASGQDAMQAFGDGLLKALGQVIVQFGEKLILMGIGNIALQNYAVGAAQIAAGGLLAGAGAYVGATVGGAGGGQSTTASRNYGSSSGTNYGQGTPQRIQVEVVGTLKAAGADLKAVLKTADYRQFRTG